LRVHLAWIYLYKLTSSLLELKLLYSFARSSAQFSIILQTDVPAINEQQRISAAVALCIYKSAAILYSSSQGLQRDVFSFFLSFFLFRSILTHST